MIKNNSKYIKKNDIFIATHTLLEDRHFYINDAINKGASLIITDKDINHIKAPYIKVHNTNKTYYEIYNNLYNKPFDNIKLIGITGTDGKTTSSYITYQLLNNFYKTAYLGTNGLIYNNKNISTKNTTPDIKTILEIGKELKENNVKYLVMEASSEGLLNNRLEGLSFYIKGLTSISKDHLNIHKSLKNYIYSKLKLFKNNKNGYSILNRNDKYYKLFKKNSKNVITYGEKLFSNYRIKDIKIYYNYTTFKLRHRFKTHYIKSPYVGSFNVYNLTLAIVILNKLGIKLDNVIKCIKSLKPTEGRVNFLEYGQNYKIILDYAHTSYATEEILKFASSIKKNRIITVLGCAGGRYKEKRKEIGSIASKYSDVVIFTMDDSRFEKLDDIFKDIIEGVTKDNYLLIRNRKKAIYKALNLSRKDDVVLILGKGIDNYMAIKDKYYKYSDLKVIDKYFMFHKKK